MHAFPDGHWKRHSCGRLWQPCQAWILHCRQSLVDFQGKFLSRYSYHYACRDCFQIWIVLFTLSPLRPMAMLTCRSWMEVSPSGSPTGTPLSLDQSLSTRPPPTSRPFTLSLYETMRPWWKTERLTLSRSMGCAWLVYRVWVCFSLKWGD